MDEDVTNMDFANNNEFQQISQEIFNNEHEKSELGVSNDEFDLMAVANDYEMQQIEERNREEAMRQRRHYNAMQMEEVEPWEVNEDEDSDWDEDDDMNQV